MQEAKYIDMPRLWRGKLYGQFLVRLVQLSSWIISYDEYFHKTQHTVMELIELIDFPSDLANRVELVQMRTLKQSTECVCQVTNVHIDFYACIPTSKSILTLLYVLCLFAFCYYNFYCWWSLHWQWNQYGMNPNPQKLSDLEIFTKFRFESLAAVIVALLYALQIWVDVSLISQVLRGFF